MITGFIRHERHISEITSYTEPIFLGSIQGESPKDLQEIADLITASGINYEVTDELDKYLWAKMLYNCALNALESVLDVTYGELTENPYTIEIMNRIIEETFNVIKASGYETFWETPEEYKDIFYSKLVPDTYNHYSSTHHDIQMKIYLEKNPQGYCHVDLNLIDDKEFDHLTQKQYEITQLYDRNTF